jgi:hypothetical protein
MSGPHVREELGAYVLGRLEPDEREAVSAHLGTCTQCAAEYARLAQLPALLRQADGIEIPAAPPAVAAVAAGIAGAALGAGITALAVGGDDAGAPAGQYAVQLKGGSGASARAQLEPGGGGTEVHLWVKGLPPGAEAVYEVRCERPGWSASAGTFRADARGHAYVVLTTAARIGEYERIRVVRRSDKRDAEVMSGEIQ